MPAPPAFPPLPQAPSALPCCALPTRLPRFPTSPVPFSSPEAAAPLPGAQPAAAPPALGRSGGRRGGDGPRRRAPSWPRAASAPRRLQPAESTGRRPPAWLRAQAQRGRGREEKKKKQQKHNRKKPRTKPTQERLEARSCSRERRDGVEGGPSGRAAGHPARPWG